MDEATLSEFLDKNANIECRYDDDALYFRNINLLWYRDNPDSSTRITREKFAEISAGDLLCEINRGLEVEHITRVTGYFTKVSQWNPGKRGELRDRVRKGL